MSVDGDKVTVNMNTVNDKGVFITIEKEYSLDELMDKNSPRGIKELYLQYKNTQINRVIEATKSKKNANEFKKLQAEATVRNQIIKKFDTVFADLNIPIKIDYDIPNTQKAKIQLNSSKDNVEVIINGKSAGSEDVVHEYLHLFLIPLKYKNPEMYYALLHSLNDDDINNTVDINEKEELFVKKVSDTIIKQTNLLDELESPELFVELIKKSIQTVNPEYDGLDVSSFNPWDILQEELHVVLGVAIDSNHKMFNASMVMTEPTMRKWMKDKGINLKCY